jgi:hypothetical protein
MLVNFYGFGGLKKSIYIYAIPILILGFLFINNSINILILKN